MANKTEGAWPGEAVLMEGPRGYSRDEITVLSGEVLAAGQVVAKITASGKYVAYDPDNSAAGTGAETPAGIVVEAVDASAGDAVGVAIVRHAVLRRSSLAWTASAGAAEKLAAEAVLKSAGVIVREGV